MLPSRLVARKKLRVNSEREVESFDEQGRSDKVERCCDVLITWHDGPTSLPRLKAFCKVTLLGCTTYRDAPPFKKETDSGSRLSARFLQRSLALMIYYESYGSLTRSP